MEEHLFLSANILAELSMHDDNRRELLDNGIIPTLKKIQKTTQNTGLKSIVKKIVSQLEKEDDPSYIIELGGRPAIVRALMASPEEKTAMLKRLVDLAKKLPALDRDKSEQTAKILVKPDILNQIKHLLLQKSPQVQQLACNFIRHLAHISKCKKILVQSTIMAPLVLLLASDDEPVKKKTKSALFTMGEDCHYAPQILRHLKSPHANIAALAESVLISSPILYIKVMPEKESACDPLDILMEDIEEGHPSESFILNFRKAVLMHHHVPDHGGVDDMAFLANINLGKILATDILHCSDDQLYNYLPLIVKLMRQQTDTINTRDTLQSAYYTKTWSETVDALLYRVHTNPDVGQLLSWLENMGLGIASSSVNKKKRAYSIQIAYLSQARKDTQQLFNFLATHRVSLGQEKGYTISKILILDPVTRYYKVPCFMRGITVQKVFRSKAAPILTSLFYDSSKPPTNIIFKKGEDLSRDLYVQTLFTLFNKLWELAPLHPQDTPYLEKYTVLPVGIHGGEGIGVIQAVKSIAVYDYDWSKIEELSKDLRRNFLRSVAGAFVAGHILTIRDRHMHNMLLKDENSCYLQIDFEHVFDPKSSLGPPVAIHPQMRTILQQLDEWNGFLDLCVEAFMVLRNFAGLITNFCCLLFETSVPNSSILIPKLLSDAFMLGQSTSVCRAQFREIFDRAPDAVSYKFKTWVHMFGQKYVAQDVPNDTDEMKSVWRAQAMGLSTGLGTTGTARKFLARAKSMPTLTLPPELQLQISAVAKKHIVTTSSESKKKHHRHAPRTSRRHYEPADDDNDDDDNNNNDDQLTESAKLQIPSGVRHLERHMSSPVLCLMTDINKEPEKDVENNNNNPPPPPPPNRLSKIRKDQLPPLSIPEGTEPRDQEVEMEPISGVPQIKLETSAVSPRSGKPKMVQSPKRIAVSSPRNKRSKLPSNKKKRRRKG